LIHYPTAMAATLASLGLEAVQVADQQRSTSITPPDFAEVLSACGRAAVIAAEEAASDAVSERVALLQERRLRTYTIAASCCAVGTKPIDILAIARQFDAWAQGDVMRLDILAALAASYRLDSGRPVKTRAREMLDDASAVLGFVEGMEKQPGEMGCRGGCDAARTEARNYIDQRLISGIKGDDHER